MFSFTSNNKSENVIKRIKKITLNTIAPVFDLNL